MKKRGTPKLLLRLSPTRLASPAAVTIPIIIFQLASVAAPFLLRSVPVDRASPMAMDTAGHGHGYGHGALSRGGLRKRHLSGRPICWGLPPPGAALPPSHLSDRSLRRPKPQHHRVGEFSFVSHVGACKRCVTGWGCTSVARPIEGGERNERATDDYGEFFCSPPPVLIALTTRRSYTG